MYCSRSSSVSTTSGHLLLPLLMPALFFGQSGMGKAGMQACVGGCCEMADRGNEAAFLLLLGGTIRDQDLVFILRRCSYFSLCVRVCVCACA
eukprot:scaffold26856_cov140-Isochrysis_galbana.AAC.4